MALTGVSQEAPGDEFLIRVADKSYWLALPHHATDYIQSTLATTGEPYELGMLLEMLKHLSPGDLVLDIGANVGNHTIFLAALGGCRVFAFEPNGQLTAAIKRSARLNNLVDEISVHEVALGSKPGRGVLSREEANLGGQSVVVDDNGEFDIIPLDSLQLDAPVAAVKVDVEGMEPSVLRGARNLLRRDQPLLYVECQDLNALDAVWSEVKDLGYGYAATYNATPTHLFVPARFAGRDVDSIAIELVREKYELIETVRSVREEVADARAKYRQATEALSKERAESATFRSRVEGEKEAMSRALSNAQISYERVHGEALQYRRTSETRELQIKRLRSRLAAKDAQLARIANRATRIQKRSHKAEQRLRGELKRIKRSRPVQTAETLKNALKSPRNALRLPLKMWRIWITPKARTAPAQGNEAYKAERAIQAPTAKVLETVPVRALRRLSPETLRRRQIEAQRAGDRLRQRLADDEQLRVAVVVDDFTRQCLAEECQLFDLTPERWEAEIEAADPHLVFVESAWRGRNGAWHNAVSRVPDELASILEWCRERGIPSIFWNKEDPVHFELFLPVAAEFDHVFTTDIDLIGQYSAALGHDRVGFLPFACQPKLHNPIETRSRKEALVFAGGYYRRYEERMRDLRALVDGASRVMPVEIFDRNLGTTLDEYAFPEEYQKYIVGTLRPDEIDVAYKGYAYALNLNSVKSSQSMFARRAYELLASNTATISNYAHGLKILFGEIIPMSDSASDTEATLRKLRQDPLFTDKLRAMGLRKMLAEHTYEERLRYVVSRAMGRSFEPSRVVVDVVAVAQSEDAMARILETIKLQDGVEIRATIFAAADAAGSDHASDLVMIRDLGEAENVILSSLLSSGSSGLALLDAGHWYGPHYLEDLASATKYSDAGFIGKSRRYVYGDHGIMLTDGGVEYRPTTQLALGAGLWRKGAVPEISLAAALANPSEALSATEQFAVSRFDFCEGGGGAAGADMLELSGQLAIDSGTPLADIYRQVETADMDDRAGSLPALPLSRFPTVGNAENHDEILGSIQDDRYRVHSTLAQDQRRLIWARGRLRVEDVWPDRIARFSLATSGDASIMVVIRLLTNEGQISESFTRASGVTHAIELPESAALVQVGLRVSGPGTGFVHRLVLGDWPSDPVVQLGGHATLVVTDNYPQYDNLYRNAFVHARVRQYRDKGLDVGVFRLRPGARLGYHEFEGVEVATGSGRALERALRNVSNATIVVHFLNPAMWGLLQPLTVRHRAVVWIHGAEIQSWHRRAFNYDTSEQIEEAKRLSSAREAFWRDVFATANENVHFVFVSNAFADSVMEDLAIRLDRKRYSIIPNPIDTGIFRYEPKKPEQRKRVLSIRPYASRVYANDLAVEAVLALSEEPWFDELEFRFIGDGPLFEATLEPLRGLENVTIERRFLQHEEIAELYRDYGVILIPTRSDTHGVSRDEAMAAGMVPVTSAVAAVPEFVSEEEGYLAPPEDANALAAAITELYHDPGVFEKKSRAAADLVRRKSAADVVIPREIELITPGASSQSGVQQSGVRRT